MAVHGEEPRLWGIHTTDDLLFLSKNVIALGWDEFGDCSRLEPSREAYKNHYLQVYPRAKKGSVGTGAGMLYRFACEMKVGDYVVLPSKADRKINIGIVESEFIYEPQCLPYVQQRHVRWLKHLPRTAFSQGALYEVGCALSFFSIRNYADEFLHALAKNFRPAAAIAEPDETVAATADGIIQSTKDFILKELSKEFKGYALEEFIADLLNAMGYRTQLSPQGGDRGIDITAYKDELPPRIVVQVKSQDSDIRESTIQSLRGAMSPGDYGLFITLSDYTRNARSYLNRNPILRGINGAELVDLILKYYDRLSEKYRKRIPLKMVYIPVPDSCPPNVAGHP